MKSRPYIPFLAILLSLIGAQAQERATSADGLRRILQRAWEDTRDDARTQAEVLKVNELKAVSSEPSIVTGQHRLGIPILKFVVQFSVLQQDLPENSYQLLGQPSAVLYPIEFIGPSDQVSPGPFIIYEKDKGKWRQVGIGADRIDAALSSALLRLGVQRKSVDDVFLVQIPSLDAYLAGKTATSNSWEVVSLLDNRFFPEKHFVDIMTVFQRIRQALHLL